jgi:hypothetical protein
MQGSPLTVRLLQHPLELAAAFAAREAWTCGESTDALVRGGLQHIGMAPADAGALHIGLFLEQRLVGYARRLHKADAPIGPDLDLVTVHPDLRLRERWLTAAFAAHAERVTQGTPPATLVPPRHLPAGVHPPTGIMA